MLGHWNRLAPHSRLSLFDHFFPIQLPPLPNKKLNIASYLEKYPHPPEDDDADDGVQVTVVRKAVGGREVGGRQVGQQGQHQVLN